MVLEKREAEAAAGRDFATTQEILKKRFSSLAIQSGISASFSWASSQRDRTIGEMTPCLMTYSLTCLRACLDKARAETDIGSKSAGRLPKRTGSPP